MFKLIRFFLELCFDSEEAYYNDPYVEYLSETTYGTYVSLKDVWNKNQELYETKK